MATNKIDFMTIRKLLALAGEIQNMRPDFAKRLDVFLPGLGRILNANRASAYQVSFSSSGQKAVPLAEFRRTSAGLLQRTALVGARTGHLRLDAMQRAERVTTVRGVPPWLPSLTLRSMVARKHSLYSCQYCDDSLAIAVLIERSPRQDSFATSDKVVVDMMWNSFRVSRKDALHGNMSFFPRAAGTG